MSQRLVASRWAVAVAALGLCAAAAAPAPPTTRPTTRPAKYTPDEIAAMIPAGQLPDAKGHWPDDSRKAATAALDAALAKRVIVMRAKLHTPYKSSGLYTGDNLPVDAHARGVTFQFHLRIAFAEGQDLSAVHEGDERTIGGVVRGVEIKAYTFHGGVVKWAITVHLERARARE